MSSSFIGNIFFFPQPQSATAASKVTAEKQASADSNKMPSIFQLIVDFISISHSEGVKAFQIILNSKIPFHFSEDCRIFCEGEWQASCAILGLVGRNLAFGHNLASGHNEPIELIMAVGRIGTLKDGYIRNVPLPRVIPQVQSASHMTIAPTAKSTLPDYLQSPRWIPTLPRIGSVHGFGQENTRPFFPCRHKC